MSGGTTSAATPVQPQLRPGQGRLYLPDVRDRAFELTPKRLERLAKIAPQPTRKLPWHIGPILDQGNTSECVVHAYLHFMQAAPQVHEMGWARNQRTERYDLARQRDGFPMPHDGTTARAVLDIARERGEIAEYLWLYDEDTAKEYIKRRGLLMGGMDWFAGMFTPDKHGYVEPTGNVVGGHELAFRWYYPPTHKTYPDTWEFPQTWGDEWGNKGIGRMKGDVFRYLIFALNGDLVSGIETAIVRPKRLEAAA
jgi:hypothetical protein